MGVLSGKDIFSAKYLTALVINSENRAQFIPIKNPIGDYFVAVIDGQLYVFKITDKIITWRAGNTVRSFRFIIYHTSHFMPLDPENTKELENVLEKNNLPKVNMQQFKMFKLLSNREKKPFVEHDIEGLIKEVQANAKENPENAKNIITFLKSLDSDKIVTPVKKVADFIQEDLLATNAGFLGEIIAQWERAELVKKKVTNSPIGAKNAWLKPLAIMAAIGILALVGWMIYDSGIITNALPNFGAEKPEDIMAKYPDPNDLRDAIDRGEVDYSKLDPQTKKIIDNLNANNPKT